jgi:hypothetical protein
MASDQTLAMRNSDRLIRHNPAFGIATEIVRSQMVNADSLGVSAHCIPDYVSCHSFALPSPILRNSSEHLAFRHSYVAEPSIYEALAPGRHSSAQNPVSP